MNTDYSPLPQNRSTRHQPKKDNAIIFCIRIAEQCTSYLSPDITGGAFFYGVEAIEDTYGAFGANMSKTHNYAGHTAGDKSWPELMLYASNSNGIYGRSYSVSVPAAYSLIIIRT